VDARKASWKRIAGDTYGEGTYGNHRAPPSALAVEWHGSIVPNFSSNLRLPFLTDKQNKEKEIKRK
jgi:hypothetical protein